jgi:hypothetical protein
MKYANLLSGSKPNGSTRGRWLAHLVAVVAGQAPRRRAVVAADAVVDEVVRCAGPAAKNGGYQRRRVSAQTTLQTVLRDHCSLSSRTL